MFNEEAWPTYNHDARERRPSVRPATDEKREKSKRPQFMMDERQVIQDLFGVPEATDVDLDGDGPFMMPLCTALEVKPLGEFTAFRFATVCGRHVLVTLTEPAAVAVGAIAGAALQVSALEQASDTKRSSEPAKRPKGLMAMIRRSRASER